MSVVTATVTVTCSVAELAHEKDFYRMFLAEQLQTRRMLELAGARVLKWMGRKDYPLAGSDHTWLIECEESVLTVLTLTCYNVKIFES